MPRIHQHDVLHEDGSAKPEKRGVDTYATAASLASLRRIDKSELNGEEERAEKGTTDERR
jgi:hypothetical protein